MKLVEACLKARKDRESSFHQWAGAVKVVQSCLSASKDQERRFHHYGGAVKLVEGCHEVTCPAKYSVPQGQVTSK